MKFYLKKVLPLILFLLLGFGSDAAAQRRKPVPKPVPKSVTITGDLNYPAILSLPKALTPERQRRYDAFDTAWSTIYRYYFDATFGNLNWMAVRREFQPRILAAKTDEAAHELIEEMIGRLKVSHLAIISPKVYETIAAAKLAARRSASKGETEVIDESEETASETQLDENIPVYGIGIELRSLNGQLIITRVHKGSPAESAGLKAGYILDSINALSIPQLLAKVEPFFARNERLRKYIPITIVNEILNGEKDSTLQIGYLDANDRRVTAEVKRGVTDSALVTFGSSFPDGALRFETRKLEGGVGYIHFNNFSLPVVAKFCDALTDLKGQTSLIIDLRGNTGGLVDVGTAIAGMLSDKPIDLGTSIYRSGSTKQESQPKLKQFTGRLVVVTDQLTVSAAEMLAASLQVSGRALIIGERSAGETLPALTAKLATGATLIYPIANYRSPSGNLLEGEGIAPDEVVSLDRASLLSGKDVQIDAATALLTDPKAYDAMKVGRANLTAEKSSVFSSGVLKSTDPPPPPPPIATKPNSTGTPPAILTPIVQPAHPGRTEPKAVEIMAEFAKQTGGTAVYSSITSYEMKGVVQMSAMGSQNVFAYQGFRDGNKMFAEIMVSDAIGEIRDIRDGKTMQVKTELGKVMTVPFPVAIEKSDFVYSLTNAMTVGEFKSLQYLGIFERDGRKVQLIDGITKEGVNVAMYFDAETKMLSGYEGPQGGSSFADYRKVEGYLIPFEISSLNIMKLTLSEIKLNTKIDPAVFQPRTFCYDKAN